MHSLIEAHGAEDDWSGLGDAKLRRKLQTRLNVRAHREYPVAPTHHDQETLAEEDQRNVLADAWAGKRKLLATKACQVEEHKTIVAHVEVVAAPTRKTSIRLAKRRKPDASSTSLDTFASSSSISSQDVDSLFPQSVNLAEDGPCRLSLAAQALMDLARMPDKPREEVWGHQQRPSQRRNFVFCLPLSNDHLIVVVQFNVLRGLLSNMAALNRLDELQQHYPDEKPPLFPGPDSGADVFDDEQGVLSMWNDKGGHHPKRAPIPQSLMPTALQRSAAHGSWIDYAPSGTLRDNLIRHEHSFDHDELLRDILGSVCTKPSITGGQKPGGEEGCGLIVWKDPWSPSGWEVSEGFMKKWWFLTRGCTELLESTNRWRSARGEEPLVVEL